MYAKASPPAMNATISKESYYVFNRKKVNNI
jgi:hypothetical protein